MGWEQFKSLKLDPSKEPRIKKSYSVTGDILSFQICPRQYGMYTHHGFHPAHMIQMWFGLTIHQVLNKLNQQYTGVLDPKKKGQVPSSEDVKQFFEHVTDNLAAVGIRAINQHEKELALNVIQEFNRIEGPLLYPNIVETEYKFQSNLENYILEGIVDVLKHSESDKIPLPEDFDNIEIWDYKAARNPQVSQPGKKINDQKIEKYRYQMRVYAQLYKLKTGKFPRCGRLYFMNELMDKSPDDTRRERAIISIDFTNPEEIKKITKAMETFDGTVKQIEHCRESDRWAPPKFEDIHDKDTCDGCDLRWNCSSVRYKPRFP
jgi:putative RecB family exonuclease